MAYKVINKKTGKEAFGGEIFKSKTIAEQAIIDAIRGAFLSKNSIKYYREYSVRKINKK